MKDLLQVTGCSAELQRPGCDSGCLSERYRSITGECNNRSALPQTHNLWFDNSKVFFSFRHLCVCCVSVPSQKVSQVGRRKHPVLPLAASGVRGRVGDTSRLGPRTHLPQRHLASGQNPAAASPSALSPCRGSKASLFCRSRCGRCLRRCSSPTTATSLWTPACPTCWWSGASG